MYPLTSTGELAVRLLWMGKSYFQSFVFIYKGGNLYSMFYMNIGT